MSIQWFLIYSPSCTVITISILRHLHHLMANFPSIFPFCLSAALGNHCIFVSINLLFQTSYTNGPCLPSFTWRVFQGLHLCCSMYQRSISFTTKQYSSVWIYYILFIQSSFEGQWGLITLNIICPTILFLSTEFHFPQIFLTVHNFPFT